MTEPRKEVMGSKPVPDPTILTTQQLYREVERVESNFNTRMANLESQLHTQTTHFDKKLDMMQQKIVDAVGGLQHLHEEKFRSIQTQFTERDIRTEQTSRDSKVAVDAALQAAKEAVAEQNRSAALAIAKSEASTTKQIDQLGVLIQTTAAGLSGKNDDIKERLTLVEGRSSGINDQSVKNTNSSQWVIGVAVAAVLALIGLIVSIVGMVLHR